MTKQTNNVLIIVFICYYTLSFVRGGPINYNDCGSAFDLNLVDIENCDSLPCRLVMGQKYDIMMEFVPSHKVKKMRHEVFINIRNYYTGLYVTPDDACTSIKCPLTNDMLTRFKATMHVNETLADLVSTLYWRTYDHNDAMIICMKTSLLLVDPFREDGNDLVHI